MKQQKYFNAKENFALISSMSKELNLSEATLIYSFPRTKKNFAKRGIILTKKGRGETAEYFLDYEEQKEK